VSPSVTAYFGLIAENFEEAPKKVGSLAPGRS
jgi:hypothetical protein